VERWSPVSVPRPYIGFRNTARSGKQGKNAEQSVPGRSVFKWDCSRYTRSSARGSIFNKQS
jgi:hypothetical protein